jgi:hypothetical protein
MRKSPALLLAFVCSLASAGCRRSGVIGRAEASAPSAAAAAADRTARILRGDDDEDGGSGTGGKKWRDTGVYVDGKPLGVLSFGELPIRLKPIFVEEKHSAEIEPGSHSPGYELVKERRYRFSDLVVALGVKLTDVKEIHVMGPKFSEVVIATGAELRSKLGEKFMFRFGGQVGGKAIPLVPRHFGNEMKPDKIAAVMIYVKQRPPVLVPDEGLALDGKMIEGIPYYGDQPLRGGVRVYQDDLFVFQIKRPLLRQTEAIESPDGVKRWKLWTLLAPRIDPSKAVEAWLIRDERRRDKLTRAELESITFEMGEKEQNKILLGDRKIPASAIAIHSHALSADELPQVLPSEQD